MLEKRLPCNSATKCGKRPLHITYCTAKNNSSSIIYSAVIPFKIRIVKNADKTSAGLHCEYKMTSTNKKLQIVCNEKCLNVNVCC